MNFKKMTFLCMQRLTNFPYIEEDFDALTNYELLCKVVEYLNKVIANENNQNDAIIELANSFTELKNYIDNLDFQDEVNNKLDEMAEDGSLDNIIAQYLNINTVFEYNNINELKESNLSNGSHAKTNGYYELNDGGGAEYIIREKSETDVDNGGSIIFLNNNLVAEMIVEKVVNVLSWGVKKQDSTTQTNLNKLLSYYNNGNIAIFFPSGEYYLTQTLYLPQKTKIYGNGNSTILSWYGSNNQYMLDVRRATKFCSISNLYINGRNIAYGIFDCDGTVVSTGNRGVKTRIYDIIMENMILGIRLDGMGSELHNIIINGSGENGSYSNVGSIGLYVNGTDNFINSVRIQLFYKGMYIVGANNRFVTVKTCVNQIGTELNPGESGLYIIDLQENYQDNLIMNKTIEANLIINNQNAGISDSYLNGNNLQYSLIKMIECRSIDITGTLGCRTKLGNGSCGNEKYALYIDELSSNITGNFSYIYPINNETSRLDKPLFHCFETLTNKITINNELLTPESAFVNGEIDDVWIASTMDSYTFSGNVMTTNYKNSVDINSENLVLNFQVENQDVPQVIEIDCSKLVFSKMWIQVASITHSSYNKHVDYGLDYLKFLSYDGNCKLKFKYIGNTQLVEQYGQQIEDLIGYPVERISFQIFGYILDRSNVESIVKVAPIE